jgi:UDP:flavonoid glycosyltransferase YjiC (YdhE family)
MKIDVVTVGSRGDVQPYVALGLGLQCAGHTVKIITDPLFESFICRQGLDFAPIRADPRQALQDDVRKIGGNPFLLARWIERQFNPLARSFMEDLLAASTGTDAILYSVLAFAATHVASARKIPALPVYLHPVNPTRYFSSPGSAGFPAWLPFRGQLNWWSFRSSNLVFFWIVRKTIDQCRREVLGLPPVPWKVYASLDTAKSPLIYGYSPHVIPKPPDWGDWLHVTGYWFLEQTAGWQPPAALLDFLQAGPPPVYIGFGSMLEWKVAHFTRLVVDALQNLGLRAILHEGWGELGAGDLPDNLFGVQNVPHDWLFPQMAALVHHGGAGTTAAGLRAGVPAVIVPFFADQPFWGERLRQLGVGPAPIPRRKLTAENLTLALRQAVSDPALRQRAAELGQQIRLEAGVDNAVRLIEQYLGASWSAVGTTK